MIRSFLFTLIFSLQIIRLFGQERTSIEPAKCLLEGTKITKAIGWWQDQETGKWIENNNASTPKKLKEYSLESVMSTNGFIFYKICKTEDNFYLIKKQSIHIGLECSTKGNNISKCCETLCYILTSNQYKKIKTACAIQSNSVTIITGISIVEVLQPFTGKITEYSYNENELMKKVAFLNNQLAKEGIEELGTETLSIQRTSSQGKDVVRFLFDESLFPISYFELPFETFIKALPE